MATTSAHFMITGYADIGGMTPLTKNPSDLCYGQRKIVAFVVVWHDVLHRALRFLLSYLPTYTDVGFSH